MTINRELALEIIAEKRLKEDDYIYAADRLNCEIEAIKAVAEVESRGDGFEIQRDGHIAPKILFEAHWFGRYTGYKYNKSHPNLSVYKWGQAKYGKNLDQHIRLQEAVKLDREAALMSCSWGKFQLMGGEWKENGYDSLQHFINAMYEDEFEHLKGFCSFVERKANGRLIKALQNKDWKTFAYYYNGPGYKKNNYDVKMEGAYRRLKNNT